MDKKMRITDSELEMLKSFFSERDELLKTIRNLFFGLPLTDEEKKQIIQTFSSNEPLRKLMRKQFLPELQSDIPIGQCIDLWMTIDFKDKSDEEMLHIIRSRRILIDMIDKVLLLLENPDGEKVNLSSWENLSWEYKGDNLVARNQFISHIDQQLMTIKILAGIKTESVEETKKRLLQNSNK